MTRYKCDLGKGMIQKINQVLYERQSTVLMLVNNYQTLHIQLEEKGLETLI